MSSGHQQRYRGPRAGPRGSYQQNMAPRNQMATPYSVFPAPFAAPVHYQDPVAVRQFIPSPGTVTTVWDPSHFPAGPPRSPSVIMHPKQNPRTAFYPQAPQQKSVTFTADGRFVSSHSTLPLYRNDHQDFPPLPGRGVPLQQQQQQHYQPSANFSFTVPNPTGSGLFPTPGHPVMLPPQNPGHAHMDLTTMNLSNGGSFGTVPLRHHNGHVPRQPWINGNAISQVYHVPHQPTTPFTVLPFDASASWQHQAGHLRTPAFGNPRTSLLPDSQSRFNNWSSANRSLVPSRLSGRIATDIRLIPGDGGQVPVQLPHEQRAVNGGGFYPRHQAPSAGPPPNRQPFHHHPTALQPFQSDHVVPASTSGTFLVQHQQERNQATFTAEDFLQRRMYREAAFNIIKFGRQNDFPMETIAFPLLCNGNSALLEKYVAKQPDLQMKLIKLLELLHVDNSLNRSIVREYTRDYCRPMSCGLHFQKLKKIATSWVHAFGIDPFEIASIYLDKCHGAIMYLIKNSTFEDISVDAWLETVDDLIKPFPEELKAFTLNQLIFRRKDNEIMGRVMRLWNIESWNGKMADELLKIPAAVAASKPNDVPSKTVKSYYQFGLIRENIELVDTVVGFHNALTEFESGADCILGIDCEWNSSRTGLEVAELALLQIATRSSCYLLDIFTLKQIVGLDEWRHLTDVFQNPRIQKLGFDFSQDMQMLKPFLPGYGGGYQENNIVDVKPLAELLAEEYPDVFGNEKSPTDIPEPELRAFGLASLVERVLGAPLSKLERMSNWEGRPMREAQIVYAATDAHCLIEIYNRLAENCYARSIQFPPKSVRVRDGGSRKSDQPRKFAHKKDSTTEPASPVDSANGSGLLENSSESPPSPVVESLNGFEEAPPTDETSPVGTGGGLLPVDGHTHFETDLSF